MPAGYAETGPEINSQRATNGMVTNSYCRPIAKSTVDPDYGVFGWPCFRGAVVSISVLSKSRQQINCMVLYSAPSFVDVADTYMIARLGRFLDIVGDCMLKHTSKPEINLSSLALCIMFDYPDYKMRNTALADLRGVGVYLKYEFGDAEFGFLPFGGVVLDCRRIRFRGNPGLQPLKICIIALFSSYEQPKATKLYNFGPKEAPQIASMP